MVAEVLQPEVAGCSIAANGEAGADWDAFVERAADSSLYHLSGWTELAREVFGHRTVFVEARDRSGSLLGVLPVVQQRSLLLGNFATSVAFFNYGGPVAQDEPVASALMVRAAAEAERLGCRYLEFRDTKPRPGNWAQRTDKVTLQLALPSTFDALSKTLGSKLRSQVKRAERENLVRRTGGLELLDDFYSVFAENMRDLGTPVYPKRFFEAILSRYGSCCQLIVIDWNGEPGAAAFLAFWRGSAEVPWASCRARAKPIGLNMKLYWELLSIAVERGCALFDFGRSTVDSGTYRFKKQWGAEPVPMYWYRWDRRAGAHEAEAGESKVMQLATAVWQRLPLGVANAIGPLISGALPW
ncbi:MAG: FemAB family PEP-CTERM system-associated protein [Proteobacteria bacterium]|nr:FemAB family PEP-CTERM system-associated protein [Pseudomonadota bacterium]